MSRVNNSSSVPRFQRLNIDEDEEENVSNFDENYFLTNI